MAKVTTTYYATLKVPAAVNFTCGHCGKNVNQAMHVFFNGSASGRGYENAAAREQAQRNMVAGIEPQLKLIEESISKGDFNRLVSEKNKMGRIECPECKTRALLVKSGKQKTLHPKRFILKIVGFYLLIVTVFAISMGLVSAGNGGGTGGNASLISGGVMLMEFLALAFLFFVIIRNRKLSKKAYADKELMKQRYNRALTDHMTVMLMPLAGSVRTIQVDADEINPQ